MGDLLFDFLNLMHEHSMAVMTVMVQADEDAVHADSRVQQPLLVFDGLSRGVVARLLHEQAGVTKMRHQLDSDVVANLARQHRHIEAEAL